MYLLDTTHCLQFILGFPKIQHKQGVLRTELVVTNVIVRGELLFGAHKSGRLTDSLTKIDAFFEDITVLPIDEITSDIYGDLKNVILNQFGPKDKNKRRNFKVESLGFKDNDLWIVSTAIQYSLILVSEDNHVLKLHGINELKTESW